jgi:hypothetical protein
MENMEVSHLHKEGLAKMVQEQKMKKTEKERISCQGKAFAHITEKLLKEVLSNDRERAFS